MNNTEHDLIQSVGHLLQGPLTMIVNSTQRLRILNEDQTSDLVKREAHSIEQRAEQTIANIKRVMELFQLDADQQPEGKGTANVALAITRAFQHLESSRQKLTSEVSVTLPMAKIPAEILQHVLTLLIGDLLSLNQADVATISGCFDGRNVLIAIGGSTTAQSLPLDDFLDIHRELALDLLICKRLVERYQGEVLITGHLNAGDLGFQLSLPALFEGHNGTKSQNNGTAVSNGHSQGETSTMSTEPIAVVNGITLTTTENGIDIYTVGVIEKEPINNWITWLINRLKEQPIDKPYRVIFDFSKISLLRMGTYQFYDIGTLGLTFAGNDAVAFFLDEHPDLKVKLATVINGSLSGDVARKTRTKTARYEIKFQFTLKAAVDWLSL